MPRNFVCKQMRLKKCESDFWFRACRLANLYNEYFKCDILFDPECKNRLLGMYTKFFKTRYNESDTCTWRILCECNNCRDLKKLTLITENSTLNNAMTGFYANPWIICLNPLLLLLLYVIKLGQNSNHCPQKLSEYLHNY